MRSSLLIGAGVCLAASACDRSPGASGSASPDAARPTATAAAPQTSAAPPADAEPPADAHRPPGPRNVLLLTVDALRQDMPWQGYERDIAPHLTALAKKSVVYPRAYSVASATPKTVEAILAGRYASTLYRGRAYFTEYSTANVFFPELLQDHGVSTMAGHAHLYFDRSRNLRQGFDTWKLVPDLKWNAETDESVTSPALTDFAIELLRDPESTKGRFFAWLHYMDPHDKYIVHPGAPRFGRRARDLYDAEIFFTDLHIKRLFDFCETQPWWKDTVIIVSADHGEAFGEHDQWKHGFTLWETVTRVPLFVAGGGVEPRTIDARRSHVDLAPTIIDLLGLPPHEGFANKSMVPELYGKEPDDREPILLDLAADTFTPLTRAAVKGDWKLIEEHGPKIKLFNLKDDPGETRDLASVAAHRADLDRMKTVFAEAWAKHAYVAPSGGGKLAGGLPADGPAGPPGWKEPDDKSPGAPTPPGR